jgi:hypothetical protein
MVSFVKGYFRGQHRPAYINQDNGIAASLRFGG